MDNNDPIQSSNLVTDDAAAAMSDTPTVEPQVVQPEPAVAPEPASVDPMPEPVPAPDPVPSPAPTVDPVPSGPSDELDSIKKNALDELQPLLKHVEQSPEERYETVMMMIRTNDDASLIGQAYEAAKEISDERDRANALLNIVSEIEYLKSKTNS